MTDLHTANLVKIRPEFVSYKLRLSSQNQRVMFLVWHVLLCGYPLKPCRISLSFDLKYEVYEEGIWAILKNNHTVEWM